jgi:4-hydroxybenzoate polyprenyltransferase
MNMMAASPRNEDARKLAPYCSRTRPVRRTIGAYVITMRPYLMFISGITGAAGLSFARTMNPAAAAAILLASFLSYGFGQALTDCFQIDTDSISSPYRPLTQGKISPTVVLAVSCAGLTGCVAIFGVLNPWNVFLGMVSGAGLATYTWFKRRWWGGPFYNAWIVTVLFLMGTCLVTPDREDISSAPMTAAILSVFFGYANFVLAGYFKDISADRATNYRTLPVVAGRRVSAVVSDLFAAFSVIAAALSVKLVGDVTHPTGIPVVPVVFCAAGFAAALVGQVRLHRVTSDAGAHRAITPGLYSYIFLLSAIASCRKPDWAIPLVLFILLFRIVLDRRPASDQV